MFKTKPVLLFGHVSNNAEYKFSILSSKWKNVFTSKLRFTSMEDVLTGQFCKMIFNKYCSQRISIQHLNVMFWGKKAQKWKWRSSDGRRYELSRSNVDLWCKHKRSGQFIKDLHFTLLGLAHKSVRESDCRKMFPSS